MKLRRAASPSSRQTHHHPFLLMWMFVSACVRVCVHVRACVDRSEDRLCPSWGVRLPLGPESGHQTQLVGGAHRQELSQHVAPHLPGTLTVRKSRVGLLAPENSQGKQCVGARTTYNFCVSAQHETKLAHPCTSKDNVMHVQCMGVSTRVCVYDRVPRGRT